MHRPHRLTRIALLAAVFLHGAIGPAFSEMTLVAPDELNKKTDELRDSLSQNADATVLHSRAAALFQQAAENTHHLPVELRGWERAASVAESGGTVTVDNLMQHYRKITMRPPPPGQLDSERQDREYRAFAFAEEVYNQGKMRAAQIGELAENAVAAYVWKPAEAALGNILFQPYFFDIAEYIGELALATKRHEAEHAADAFLSAEKVKDGELRAFRGEAEQLEKIDPTGEKFARAWIATVERSRTPEVVKLYMRHLAKLRYAHSQGEEGLKRYIEELGYKDRPGHFHFHDEADAHAGDEPAPQS